MANQNIDSKSVFELTAQEAQERLQAVADQVKRDLYAKGLPISYQDERCPTKDHYIHEYEDGRTVLVKLDIPGYKYIPVKELPKA